MESRRILQISEYSCLAKPNTLSLTTNHFLGQCMGSYRKYLLLLGPNFFNNHGHPEVQDAIIKNNFGEEIDIESFRQTASKTKMTPQSFAFFIHIAMHSALEAYEFVQPKSKSNENTASRDSKKKQKKKGKKPKKSKHTQKEIILTDSEDDESPDMTFPHDDDESFDDDREHLINRPISNIMDLDSHTDQPIAEPSGSQSSIINQSLLHIAPTITTVPPIVIQPQPQLEKQSEETLPSTKSSNKKKKSITNTVNNVITGYKPTDDGTSKVREILVYDIPASWTPEQILQQLTLWGNTISMQTKHQRKYQTLRLTIELSSFRLAQFEVNDNPTWTTDLGGIPVRWFPARWTLKERKERERFQATIHKIPDSMTLATLWNNQRPHSFLSDVRGMKSFKIIQTAKGDRKLIGYFETWKDMRAALDNQSVWDNKQLSWNRHAPPTQRTRSQGIHADKYLRTSRTNTTKSSSDKAQKDKKSKKKSEKTMSYKPPKHKKDKSRDETKEKILAEIIVLLRKIV